MKKLLFLLIIGLNMSLQGAANSNRVSTWYWLNSTDRSQWEPDFRAISETHFTHVFLCWGLDASAVATQTNNTLHALNLCQKYGLKAYLLVWHPAYNKLPREPRFQQVDNNGNLLFTFNVFHQEWRNTQWRTYLRSVAIAYKNHPAFAGYLFDDTFHMGQAGTLLGDKSKKRGDFVSYSEYDAEQFRSWLKKKYHGISELNSAWRTGSTNWRAIVPPRQIKDQNGIAWQDWCDARDQWLQEWAADTVRFIREGDAKLDHEILLEDGEYVLGRPRKSSSSIRPITLKDSIGLSFGNVARPFDAVCAYSTWSWKGTNALAVGTQKTEQILRELKSAVAFDKDIIYAFWVADPALDQTPGEYPTAQQILTITEAALRAGVHHVNYYGFRIGDWRVTDAEWSAYQSGETNYPKTKPLAGRFICDRPALLQQLAPQLRSGRKNP